MRGRTMSSTKSVCPVTFAAASTFSSGWPMTVRSFRVSSGTRGLRRSHALGGQLDRLEDLQVPRAAAEVAGQRLGDLQARWRGLLAQQRLGNEQEARGA